MQMDTDMKIGGKRYDFDGGYEPALRPRGRTAKEAEGRRNAGGDGATGEFFAAGNPFKLHCLTRTLHLCLTLARLDFLRGKFMSCAGKGSRVSFGSARETFFRVLKNVYIAREPRPFPVQGDLSGNIAPRVCATRRTAI